MGLFVPTVSKIKAGLKTLFKAGVGFSVYFTFTNEVRG